MSFKTKAILFLLLAALALLFAKREEARGSFAAVERTYVDWLLGNSREQLRPPSVTLLTIDEGLEPIFHSWPPTPLDYSIMLRRLKKNASPKVVAAEPSLHWEGADPSELEILRTAGLPYETGELLLGAVLQANTAAAPIAPRTLSLLSPIPAENIEGDLSALPEFTTIHTLPDRRLTAAGAPVGFTEIDLGAGGGDGDALHAPLLARGADSVIPSFPLLAAMLELDARPEDVRVRLGSEITIKGDLVIPIDNSGALNVFAGLRPTLPVEKATILVSGIGSTDPGGGGLEPGQREALDSRVVVLGLDDEASRVIPIGKEELISRAELFALAIATIQSGRYIEKVAEPVRWAVWACIALLGLGLINLPRKRAFALGLLAALLYLIANMLLFQSTPRWIPPAAPIALLACCLLGALIFGRGAEQREPEPS